MSDWSNVWPAKGLLRECRRLWVENAELKAQRADLQARVIRVCDWMGQNNKDAEYDLAIVALNHALEGGPQ